MAEEDVTNFDDPALKVALKRALDAERAPDSLRARVQAILSNSGDANAPLSPARPVIEPPSVAPAVIRPPAGFWSGLWSHPFPRLATAAAILLCIGLAAWHFAPGRNAQQLASGNTNALPESFAAALVATHDRCSAEPDHHILKGVPDDDFRLMTQKLRERLGFPALAATAGDGWIFDGASASCMVGQAHCAHLVFKQAGESLSIFSVAVASESWPNGTPPGEGERFTNMQAGHPILSWVHDDTVYSIVAASVNDTLKLPDIAPLADRLRVAISTEPAESPARTTVAQSF